MDFGSVDAIRGAGFDGFVRVAALRAARCMPVPEDPGIYMVVRESEQAPRFLPASPGGHFKGRDPSVRAEVLESRWIPRTKVVYIGQAGGGGSSSTLRKRLRLYVRFGAGAPVGHWGGRLIWQLADHDELQLCWLPTPDRDARGVESALLEAFESIYAALPFANLVR